MNFKEYLMIEEEDREKIKNLQNRLKDCIKKPNSSECRKSIQDKIKKIRNKAIEKAKQAGQKAKDAAKSEKDRLLGKWKEQGGG